MVTIEAKRNERRQQYQQLTEGAGVYAERVGGSSPSPPASRRRLRARAAFALVFALGAAAPAAAESRAEPMTFRVAPLESPTA